MQEALEFYRSYVKQVALPEFAGFKNNLAGNKHLYVLKPILGDKVPLLLDDFAVECGGRRNSHLEELNAEADVFLEDLFAGKGTHFFSLVGEAGSGKSAILRHITWKVMHQPEVFRQRAGEEASTAYWNLKDGEDLQVQIAKKKLLLAVFLRSSDLWRLLQHEQPNLLASTLLVDAAAASFKRLVREGRFREQDEPTFRKGLQLLLQNSRVCLAVDSLDLVPSSGRQLLLSTLYSLAKRPSKVPGVVKPYPLKVDIDLFRVISSSRPGALFKQILPGDLGGDAEEGDWSFLLLDKMFSLQLKERLLSAIVEQNGLDPAKHNLPKVAGPNLTGPSEHEVRIQSKLLRSLRSPSTIFLLSQLQESSKFMPVSVYDMFEEIVGFLRRGRRTVTAIPPIPADCAALLKVFTLDSLFPNNDHLDKVLALFALIYQCLVPHRWNATFVLQQEAISLLEHLIQSQQTNRKIWDDLLENFGLVLSKANPQGNDRTTQARQLSTLIWHFVTQELAETNLCHALDSGELLFFDEQVVQYLCARFLTDDEFSQPILDTWALKKWPVEMFAWQSSFYLCSTHWNFVYDLVGTRRGPIWFSQRILAPEQSTIFTWLATIRLNYGIDDLDLGQIKFYRLLRGFALQQEDRLLLKQRQNEPAALAHSSQEDVDVANLKEAFGMTFVSILDDNPSALIHIEKAPVSSFGCFSQNAITIIVEKLVELLRKGNIFVISDLLLNLDKNKLLSDSTIAKIKEIVASPETDYKPLRPALRFLISRQPYWQHMSVVVEALGAKDQDSQYEASNALVKMANQSRDAILAAPADPSRPNFLLYEDKDWALLFNSAVSMLMDFVDLDLNKTSKAAHYYDNPSEPKCRLAQCHHLPSLISLLESDNAGARLMPFILLGNTIRSNLYDRETELKNIGSQLLLLDALGRVYRPPDSVVGRDIIDELTKTDFATKAIAFVFLELFGEPAAKFSIVISEDLIKCKVDLLQQLSTWLWARVDAGTRRRLVATALAATLGSNAPFTTVSGLQPIPNVSVPIKLAALFHRDVLYLSTRVDYAIQLITELDIALVLTHGLLPALSNSPAATKLPVPLQRAALRYLDRAAVFTTNEAIKISALEKVVGLIDKYIAALDIEQAPGAPVSAHAVGGSPQVFIEYLLRVILDVMNHNNDKFKPLAIETLLAQNTRAKLLSYYRHGLLNHPTVFSKDSSPKKSAIAGKVAHTKTWFGKILIVEVLQQLVTPTSPDLLELVVFLSANEPELRNTTIETLRKADIQIIPKLVERVGTMTETEGDPFIRRSCVLLLGALGKRKEPGIRQLILGTAVKLLQHKLVRLQELGVTILATIGSQSLEYPPVQELLLSLLQKINANARPARKRLAVTNADLDQARSEVGLTRDEVALTGALVECAPTIGLASAELVEGLFQLLLHSPESSLRIAVFLTFRKMSSLIPKDEMEQHERLLAECLKAPEGYVRELAIKIMRILGTGSLTRCTKLLLACLADHEPFVKKQAVKALSQLITEDNYRQQVPLVSEVAPLLNDKNPLVIVQVLKFLCRFKPPTSRLQAIVLPQITRAMPAALSGTPAPTSLLKQSASSDEGLDALQDPSLTADISDDFYAKEVIAPHIDKIAGLLHKRKFRFHLPIRVSILACLGETTFLHKHLPAYVEMLNSENISTLVEFSDTLKSLGPQVLQYIPSIVNTIKPGSPLVKNLVRLLTKHERQLDPTTCNKLFGLNTITQMMKNKDPNVRRVAVTLMGKKVLEKPRHLIVLVQMWADKNNKVRKEVMDVLGDIGKAKPAYIKLIMDAIDTDSVTSVLVWRFLSKSWGVLIESSPDTPPTPPTQV